MRHGRSRCWAVAARASIIASVLFVATGIAGAAYAATAPGFSNSAVVMRAGNPTLVVDGRPFFFYGAAFFYERMPAAQWRAAMLALRAMGFNTLDLYIPWNWHERSDDRFDFDGHTNPRRNLRAVLALARELRFHLIVRPGPVIRNEWRNGGYPDWLLTRPEYGMPLHDILEGRYPATATLQNANSDDAAAQWLHNATHMRYAGRWLRTVLHEFVPYGDIVVAVQVDDDQAAYIDNQTWPAPHLQTYLRTLEAIVRDVVGPQLPVFINTYEMKVTAAAPVWAMGNWYQSDAASIGEHDRTALEFSTGLLQTQTRYPVAMSEFQAGWLAPPEDPAPRPADPTNTTLALHTLLGLGVRGVIDFPAQDTIDPAGWEAPFANANYAWDAALTADLRHSARYAPTARFGTLVQTYGPELAAARRLADGAIAYLTSAYDAGQQTNADVFAIVARTQAAQQACRAARLVCDLVDLRFIDDATLRRYPFLIVPPDVRVQPLTPAARDRLARYRSAGGDIVATAPVDVMPHTGGIADATVLRAPDGTAFLDVVNYDGHERRVAATIVHLERGHDVPVAAFTVGARDAALVQITLAQAIAAPMPVAAPIPPVTVDRDSGDPRCTDLPEVTAQDAPHVAPSLVTDDSAGDGYPRLTFDNGLVRLTVAPDAGARAFSFLGRLGRNGKTGGCSGQEIFTSVGALRDDVSIQPPLSTTDRIGKYTRSFPAGTFNRSYAVEPHTAGDSVGATFSYDAPDIVPNGAHFERTVAMSAGEPGFSVKERVTFADGPGAAAQHPVRYDSIATAGAQMLDDRADGALGFFFPAATCGCVAVIAWPRTDVEDAQILPERTSTVVRLQFAAGRQTLTRYAFRRVTGPDDARAAMRQEREAVAANR